MLGGRRARRELREARQAEADLLRVLGFENYDEFASTAEPIPPSATMKQQTSQPRPEAARSDADESIDALCRRVAMCEEELAQARHAIALLRDELRTARTPEPIDGLADARAAVFQTCAELNRACEELVREREALSETRIAAETAAEETIAAAGEVARRIIEEAQQHAVNAVRDATVTLDGVRRLGTLATD